MDVKILRTLIEAESVKGRCVSTPTDHASLRRVITTRQFALATLTGKSNYLTYSPCIRA